MFHLVSWNKNSNLVTMKMSVCAVVTKVASQTASFALSKSLLAFSHSLAQKQCYTVIVCLTVEYKPIVCQ